MVLANDILSMLHFRHACKRFVPDQTIPPYEFDLILDAGRLAPSSFGYEPWRFLVLQDRALREALRPAVWGGQGQLPTASHVVAILVRKDGLRHDSDYIAHMNRNVLQLPDEVIPVRERFYRNFQQQDFRLLDSPRALFDWGGKQAYLALAGMMNCAALQGIDSCPMEGFDVEACERVLADAGVLDREQFGLAVMVAFGYRADVQPEKRRQPREDVVQWVG